MPSLCKMTVTTLIITVISIGIIYQKALANEPSLDENITPNAFPVDTVIVQEQSTRLWKEFSGRLSAVDYVEIRPQAAGLITEVNFEDGQFVEKGDVLYVIDPRPFKAIVGQKKAMLIAAQNSHSLSKKELIRAKDLLAKKMVSQQFYDERSNAQLVADSAIKRAKAELVEAEINLSYAYVKAPVSGRISRTELTEGNLVDAGANAPLLTSIVSSGSIYADFEVDEQTYIAYTVQDSSAKGMMHHNPVELRLQSGETVFQGTIHSFDNRIDPTSGTIRARAIFENPHEKLLPGMYARLRLGSADEHKIILISERAISTDQNRKYVYRVNADNIATYCEVKVGDSINGSRVIHSGLDIGDQVIVRGLMRIQPNMLVQPILSTEKNTSPQS